MYLTLSLKLLSGLVLCTTLLVLPLVLGGISYTHFRGLTLLSSLVFFLLISLFSVFSCLRFFRFMFLLFSVHQMALGLFRMMASIARDTMIANTFGSAALLVIFLLGGFILPKGTVLVVFVYCTMQIET